MRFVAWMRDVHPRAVVLVALVTELLESSQEGCSLAVLEEKIWPLGPGADSDNVFRRQDRLRRVISNLRIYVAEYNRLYSGKSARLVLRSSGIPGAAPALDVNQLQPTSIVEAKPVNPRPVGRGTDKSVRTEMKSMLEALRWAQSSLSPDNRKQITLWLVEKSTSRDFEFSGSPEFGGEEAIRLGYGHSIEQLAYSGLTSATSPELRWKLLALWTEACEAVGLAGRLRATFEEVYLSACLAPKSDCDESILYRLRRSWLRSVVVSPSPLGELDDLITRFLEAARRNRLPDQVFEMRAMLVERLIRQAVEQDQPALLRKALQQINNMLTETGAAVSELARRSRQQLHWTARCYTDGDPKALLQESQELLAWLLQSEEHRRAMDVQSHVVRLLCNTRNWDEAEREAIRNVAQGVHFVDRVRLLFMISDLRRVVAHRLGAQAVPVLASLDVLENRLAEIVHGHGPTIPSFAGDVERDLRPILEILPRTLSPDWSRLLKETPGILPGRLFARSVKSRRTNVTPPESISDCDTTDLSWFTTDW